MTLIASLIIAAVTTAPWLIEKNINPNVGRIFGIISAVVALACIYLFTPSATGPFFGGYGVITGGLLFVSGIAGLVGGARMPVYGGGITLLVFIVTTLS